MQYGLVEVRPSPPRVQSLYLHPIFKNHLPTPARYFVFYSLFVYLPAYSAQKQRQHHKNSTTQSEPTHKIVIRRHSFSCNGVYNNQARWDKERPGVPKSAAYLPLPSAVFPWTPVLARTKQQQLSKTRSMDFSRPTLLLTKRLVRTETTANNPYGLLERSCWQMSRSSTRLSARS